MKPEEIEKAVQQAVGEASRKWAGSVLLGSFGEWKAEDVRHERTGHETTIRFKITPQREFRNWGDNRKTLESGLGSAIRRILGEHHPGHNLTWSVKALPPEGQKHPVKWPHAMVEVRMQAHPREARKR